MKAVQFTEYGEPDVLQMAEVPEPHAGAGQIRVTVRAIGVNPWDWKVRSGAMRQFLPIDFPYIPGGEVSGVVDEIGDGVTGFSVGDEVFGFAVGAAYAEYAVLAQDHFAQKPPALPWPEAAALPTAAETASRVLDQLGVVDGQTVLVNGAAGGVGLAAVQLARFRGATVIGTASEPNHDFLRSLGVTPVSYGEGLVERVREIASAGVDRAFDVAGKGGLPDLIELAHGTDNVMTIADPDAQKYGVRFSSGRSKNPFPALDQVARLVEQDTFTLPVAETFPLERVADAHRISQAGHIRGKLILLPA
ncbi:NADPH:quinone reductase-like Zn-dependent oxidoreductase [Micromonospora pisi]|uniref:NADPH:quinone reductase-like Zn-dependent oxidoreductase n=1 Tax=Micromonospora pisi TaxID=589240 RepID=A0A495JHZ4_9ACTN|nr:NADP-dependent oxidoreductase [Micromonospora pisi]RKR88670.1 NADPH:quinone reductase-like Zn-dependent oxidoreductase [Micromonospora pisi]